MRDRWRLAIRDALGEQGHPFYADTLLSLSALCQDQGERERLLRRALAVVDKAGSDATPCLLSLASFYANKGDHASAEPYLARAAAALEKVAPNLRLYTATIDEGLDERAYIVPGLGDAGDRQFGPR